MLNWRVHDIHVAIGRFSRNFREWLESSIGDLGRSEKQC